MSCHFFSMFCWHRNMCDPMEAVMLPFTFFLLLSSKNKHSASRVSLVVMNLPANARDVIDAGSILGSGTSPGGGHGNPLQYSCLENSMDRGAWWATVHGVTKSQIQLKRLTMHCKNKYFLKSYMKTGLRW